MILRSLTVFLFLGCGFLRADIHPADSASEADVESAIAAASNGDTVTVPGGSATWSDVTINKAITLQGAGDGVTNITLGQNALSITKQSNGTGHIIVEDFTFSKTSGGTSSKAILLSGPWPTGDVIILRNQTWDIDTTGFVHVQTPGGIIISNVTMDSLDDNDSIIQFKDADDGHGSWTTDHSLGTDDTTGKMNCYIEDCTITGGTLQGFDMDDSARVVFRNNTAEWFCLNSHGWATSAHGCHHFEIYDNTFNYTSSSNELANVTNGHIWLRGGSGVIYGNSFADITGFWGDKDEVRFDVRGAEDNRPQGACGAVSYPVPHQIGQLYSGGAEVTDEIRIWSNTGTLSVRDAWSWGNPCGLTRETFSNQDTVAWLLSTDASDARPGYTAYSYPHPLLSGGGPPGITKKLTTGTLTVGP